jgi:hypothetical protein
MGVTDDAGRARRRAVAVSNRNLGTNHGHMAWQRAEAPRIFRVLGDPCSYPCYSCLSVRRDGGLSIDDLRFDRARDKVYHSNDDADLSDEIEWATFGQRVLRQGKVVGIDDLAGEFYDARHLLAFDHHREVGERVREAIYRGYPHSFEANVRSAWSVAGVPRARYVHNAIGLSPDALFVLQREGTIEDIGAALAAAGADDGVILDNGGSVVCWVWWANVYAGGIVSPTSTPAAGDVGDRVSARGPVTVDLPGGSVAYSVA